jgi:hypothetical protein
MKKLLFAALLALSFSQCKKTTVTTETLPPLPGGNGENEKPVGASARGLLSADYPQLEIQISWMPGMQLQAQTITNLTNFLNTYINKPGGINIIQLPVHAAEKPVLNIDEVALYESHFRSSFTTNNKIAVHIMVTDTKYDNATVLGLAYRNTSIALMGKTIQENSGGLTQPSRVKLETTVLLHEFGHLFGLVDLGSAMQTVHKANGNHCNSNTCLMYYTAENTDILGVLLTGNIPSADANCIADMKANGGK